LLIFVGDVTSLVSFSPNYSSTQEPTMNILVVDDETDVQPLFEQRFRREIRSGEIQFNFANSGEEALDCLKKLASQAVLILSDINMPGMSGLELLRHIKEDFRMPPSPVVMMITAYGDAESHDEAMRLGADDFLTKPLDFVALKAKLKPLDNG
jgi:CheY-like chemotaxis protein